MQYLLLISDREADWARMTPEEQGKIYQEYMQFGKSITESGNKRAGNQLHPIATAKTVRVRNGKQQVTDGPFAETKEQLGGYYLVEAKDLDEAMAIAARIPSARMGCIEVRPLVGTPSPN